MNQRLLETLACPDTHHTALRYDEPDQTLTCTTCGRVFPIQDGIPMLLLDDSVPLTKERLAASPTDDEPGLCHPATFSINY